VIIDVRESEEYAEGYVAGAKHLSLGVLEQKISEVVPDISTPLLRIVTEVNGAHW
jgi:rhodanese-related sulfurtransferase